MNEQQNIENKAVIYCRVSTKEQVEEGNSLISQQKLCSDYAFKNGFQIDNIFIEEGESAKNVNRPELQKLLRYCAVAKNNIKAVIVYKLDRISRNTDDYSQIRLILKRHKVEIKSITEFFEDSPAGRFMENIIANVAQFDNDVRIERCIGGMREAMREGRYVWIAPRGFKNERVNGKMNIIQNDDAPIIKAIFNKIAENVLTAEEVRKQFSTKGLCAKNGKPICKSLFFKLLKNEAYKGWIVKLGERHKGSYDPILSEELFDHVQHVLLSRSKKTIGYQVVHPDFPLRRFVMHPNGGKLTGGWSKGRNKKYAYYQFQQPSMVFKKETLEEKFKNFINQFSFPKDKCETLIRFVKSNFSKSITDDRRTQTHLRKSIEELNESKRKLIDKNLKGIISDSIFSEHIQFIESKILEHKSQLYSLPINPTDYPEALSFATRFLTNIGEVWNKLSVHKKMQLQWFNFPEGVYFDGIEFRTNKTPLLLNLKSFFFNTPVL